MKRFLMTVLLMMGVLFSAGILQKASAQTINMFIHTLTIGTDGYISAAPDNLYYIYSDFINQSTRAIAWQTEEADLHFKQYVSSQHQFYLAGIDFGTEPAGFKNNFSWRRIQIDPKNSLTLHDGNIASAGGAQYAEVITGAEISGSAVTNIEGNGLNLYYAADLAENSYLEGRSYTLSNGGNLIPVTPYCDGDDLDLDGICDTEDNCPCTHNPSQEDNDLDGHGNRCPLADYDGDLDVDGRDLYLFSDYYAGLHSQSDIHEDTIINILDLEKFAREFGWKY